MARLLLLISLALLIGIALSVPSTEEKSTSTEKKDKAASKENRSKAKNSESNEKHVERPSTEEKSTSTDKKDKAASKENHSKAKSSESNEKHVESHEKHKKHKKDKGEKHDSESQEVHEIQRHKKHGTHVKHESHGKNKKHDNKHKKNSKHLKTKKHHKKHSSRSEQKNDTAETNVTIDHDDVGWEYENTTAVDTRRILYSKSTSKGRRPYMVYLQLTKESAKAHKYRGWLCGGVIVERYYVLTSAACVEDAEHFYIVSGTVKFVDSFDYKSDKCVCNHRRKVVWKCIPKNYKFDFQDSIKWSSNDIAIVKVNKPFKIGVVEKDCDFATNIIPYNNISRDLEKPGTKGWIAGWGSGSNFREGVYRRQKSSVHIPDNAKCLQEARVCIMDNEHCAKKWSQRFRSIIQQYMICTKDIMKRLSEICDKRYANCTDVESRRTNLMEPRRSEEIDLGRHLQDPDDYTARRSNQGGFCENDHGGPLIVKYQSKERVIGVISACKIDPKTHSCHGPFLYTSVFKNRQFISCSIYKDTEETCRRVFRTGITHEEWTVDWDNVKEDDDDRKDDDDHDNNNDDKNDDDDDETKESLREAKNQEKDKGSSSSSEESKEKSKHNKTKEKSAEKKNKTAEKKDSSSSEEKPKSKKDKKKLIDVSSETSSSDEKKRVRRANKEVFYESSRDDNVNEPNSSE